jgi:diguanylate cyclase (GGDEF)-like protein
MQRELARARRYRRPLALAMVDIDHFKDVNTAVGHVVADVVLQEVATVLADRLRTGDVLARLGGEELAVLLPEADLDAALRLGEDLRREIATHEFRTSKGVVPVTVSVGVAELDLDMTAEALLEQADQKLFAAKRSGRNRVCG